MVLWPVFWCLPKKYIHVRFVAHLRQQQNPTCLPWVQPTRNRGSTEMWPIFFQVRNNFPTEEQSPNQSNAEKKIYQTEPQPSRCLLIQKKHPRLNQRHKASWGVWGKNSFPWIGGSRIWWFTSGAIILLIVAWNLRVLGGETCTLKVKQVYSSKKQHTPKKTRNLPTWLWYNRLSKINLIYLLGSIDLPSSSPCQLFTPF